MTHTITVDGVNYVPETRSTSENIVVAITTTNRPTILAETLKHFTDTTTGPKIIVVYDNPEPMNDEYTSLLNQYAGRVSFFTNPTTEHNIVEAKNFCLQLAAQFHYDHVFLFDDDTYPLTPDWYKPYINSEYGHLQYLFDKWADGKTVDNDKIIRESHGHVWHLHGRGCMLYFDKNTLSQIGDYSNEFSPAMGEHLDMSERAYRRGLIPWAYIDIENSDTLIYSMDEHQHGTPQQVKTSLTMVNRRDYAEKHDTLLKQKMRDWDTTPCSNHPYVLTVWNQKDTDPQRLNNQQRLTTAEVFKQFHANVDKYFTRDNIVFLTDDADNHGSSVYQSRIMRELEYLETHPETQTVWLIDATDVKAINPPPQITDKHLYVGWEHETTQSEWFTTHFTHEDYQPLIEENKQLYNCGIIGGHRNMLIPLLSQMLTIMLATDSPLDMGAFNLALDRYYTPQQIISGTRINTLFKHHETNTVSAWKHK